MSAVSETGRAREKLKSKPLAIPALSSFGEHGVFDGGHVDTASRDYKAGFAAGQAQAQPELDSASQQTAALAGNFQKALESIDQHYRSECASLIEKMFAAVAPVLARNMAQSLVQDAIQERIVKKKQSITIRHNPETAAVFEEIAARFSAEDFLIFEADESLSPSAIEIGWPDGGVIYDPELIIGDILNAVSQSQSYDQE